MSCAGSSSPASWTIRWQSVSKEFGDNRFQSIAVVVLRPISDRIERRGLTCVGSQQVLQIYPRSVSGEIRVLVVRVDAVSCEGDQGVLLLPPLSQLKRRKQIRIGLG